MKPKLILLLTGLLVFSACQSQNPATFRQLTAADVSSYQNARCQEDYFSASASHRSRASAARICDVQAINAERIRREQGQDGKLPFDRNDPR